MNNPLNSLNQETLTDQTKEQASQVRVPAEGLAFARLVTYVELGVQVSVWKGEEKTAPKVILGFELLSPKHMHEGKGDYLSTGLITLSTNSKAKFFKLFNDMRYKREGIRHMSQLLGEEFLITVEHNTVGDKTYANIKSVAKPYIVDPVTGDEKKLSVPKATKAMQVFVWNQPTMECWDSIFIDGSYQRDGVDVSKNYLQNKILSAVNFSGSPVEGMLANLGLQQDAVDPLPCDTADEVEEVSDLDRLGL